MVLLAAAGIGGVAKADVAIWTNTGGKWGNPSNWTDSVGTMLTVAPTNAASHFEVKMVSPGTTGQRYPIDTGKAGGSSSSSYLLPEAYGVDPTIDSISGENGVEDTWRYYIQQGDEDKGTHYALERTFTVYNPNDFFGYWRVHGQKNGFTLPATDSFVPTLGNLSLMHRPSVTVPDAATTGAVGNVYAFGVLEKRGAGALSLGASVKQDSVVILKAGEIVVEGLKDGTLDDVLAGAAVHLDASRTDTMTFGTSHDDAQYEAYRDLTTVTRWEDVRGAGYPYATVPYGAVGNSWWSMGNSIRAPFVSPATSPTGLRLVDFGTKGNANQTGPAPVDMVYGPTSCVLRLDKLVKDVRDAFWVVQTPGSPNGRTILGVAGNTGLGFMSDSDLFATYNSAGVAGRNGDLTFNGSPINFKDGDKKVLTNLTVVADTVGTGADVQLLGSDRYYRLRSGGSRIGEVILFTNLLSRADRGRINDYLVRKWITGDTNTPAVGSVVANAADVGIGVPEGRVAQVGDVVAANGFTKTGGGELVAERIVASGGKVVVGGGSLRVAGSPEIVARVADDPYMWLDADDPSTYVEVEVEGDDATYLSAWKDCREGVDLQATARAGYDGNYPKVVTNATRGHAAINLSVMGTGKQTYFTLPTWPALGTSTANQKVYAGLIAYRPLGGSVNIFGSSNMEMFRQSFPNNLISPTYSAATGKTLGMLWTVNGVSVDPYAVPEPTKTINQTQDFIVVAFLTDSPVTANGIAKDRNDNTQSIKINCGGMEVGEALFYHRPLTRDEFRATEAYLMEKWLGKAHPASTASRAKLSFAEGMEATINADADFDVVELETATSTLRKTGVGAVAVERVDHASVADGVAVDGGSLSLKFDFSDKALFHLDAEDSDDAFDTYELDGKTFVTKWRDVRRNGWYAAKTTQKFKYYAITNPTLHQVTMPDGRSRRALCFGPRRNTNDASTTDKLDCAAYKFSSVFSNIREIFTVFANTGSGGPGEIVGNDTSSLPKSNFRRSDGGHILVQDRTETKRVVDGYMAVNGVPRANTYKLVNDTPYVISYGTTSNAYAGAVLQDRDCNAGGGMMFEQIAFSYPLTAVERKWMEQCLMYKWGFTNAAPRVSIANIAVANGATLDVGSGVAIQVSALSGGGTICAESVHAASGTAFAFEYRAADDVDHLTVNGALTLDGATTVRVTFAEGAVVAGGEWTLLSATGGITGLNLAATAFDITLPVKWRTKLFVRNGALGLRIAPKGIMLNFR